MDSRRVRRSLTTGMTLRPKLRQYRLFSYLDFQDFSLKFQPKETETDRVLLEIDNVLNLANVPETRDIISSLTMAAEFHPREEIRFFYF